MHLQSHMYKTLSFIAICASFTTHGALQAQQADAPKLQMIVAGQEVILPGDVTARVVSQMEKIVESSSIDSIHEPGVFSASRPSAEQVLKDSFLRVTYPQPHTFKVSRGVLSADRIEVGLAYDYLPGEWLLRDKDHLIRLAKYSGQECVHLARVPGFTERLPKAMQEKLPAYSNIP